MIQIQTTFMTERATPLPRLLGDCPAIREARMVLRAVAPLERHLILSGETGTGKELFARNLHARSHRAPGPFQALRMGKNDPREFAARIFGLERGGNGRVVPGVLERAGKGTLFLDGIERLDLAQQAGLLRALFSGTVVRLGGRMAVPADVRIVAGTSADLAGQVRRGRFREDLYSLLGGIPVALPALRDRGADIELLGEYFLTVACLAGGRSVPGLTGNLVTVLREYSWPGNLNELKEVMASAAAACRTKVLRLRDLPGSVVEPGDRAFEGAFQWPTIRDLDRLDLDLKEFLERVETRLLAEALQGTGGNRNRAAESLGIKRTTLVEKLKKKGM
ncbi:MAG TPA: sigma 54-interacting transcriptional regulator [Desulfomicrobiaceae bacterium]|nr:sigma 54-interacting transcriptional regulator [Desulfomicrobiaceae bacterium]